MKNIKLFFAVIIAGVLLVPSIACARRMVQEDPITPDSYIEHVKKLASDDMKGRHGGSVEEKQAANYIIEKFKEYGLNPAPGTKNYIQSFKLPKGPDPTKSYLKIIGKDKNQVMPIGPDLTYMAPCPSIDYKGDMVCAVYGVRPPAGKKYDSMKDKVVVMVMAPALGMDAATYRKTFGTLFVSQIKEIENSGAKAIIVLHNDVTFKFVQGLEDSNIPKLVMHFTVADKVFKEFDAVKVSEKVGKDAGPIVFDIKDQTMELKINSGIRDSLNIVGVLPGTDLKDEYVIVGAHMDHLGSLLNDEGKFDVYNGADDNASGVAGLLETASAFKKLGIEPRRTIVFIAFGSEEIGVLGSAYYVKNPLLPLDKAHVMVNLDMIGRNANNTISVSCLGSAEGLKDLAVQISNMTDSIKTNMVEHSLAGGDHANFYLKKVPSVFFCNLGHFDYHKPTDTIDKINPSFGSAVSQMAFNYVRNFANMDKKFVYKAMPVAKPKKPRGKRAKLGFMPEFTFQGKGVQVAEPTPGGPCDVAGVKNGDVIIKIDDNDVVNMDTYIEGCEAAFGKKKVKIKINRGGVIIEKELILEK